MTGKSRTARLPAPLSAMAGPLAVARAALLERGWERWWRKAMIGWAVVALAAGLIGSLANRPQWAHALWMLGTVPVLATLGISMLRDLLGGRLGVDAIALLSMSAALVFGEALAAVVVAIMYAGGTVLEDFAITRAERDLKALADRAPRLAHRLSQQTIDDVAVEQVAIGDRLIVRGGEIVPVDGTVDGPAAMVAVIDESVLTGEPIPVTRRHGEPVLSGPINAGPAFELRATALAAQSAYAGIVRMVTAAQTAKAPFMRLADRYALLLLPVAVGLALLAWWLSGEPRRAIAVLVAATPCPLILAAPVAFISGVARAARRGILVKGGGPLEALAAAHTIIFDKTGTLTVGGARVLAIETAPGQQADEVLRQVASLEQASPHVLARAIVTAAKARDLRLSVPSQVREDHGEGLSGTVDGRSVRVGAQDFVAPGRALEPWARRAVRRGELRSSLGVFVAVDGQLAAVMLMGDALRPETPRALAKLRRLGARRLTMLTGDRADAAADMAAAIDIDRVHAECSPEEKQRVVAAERAANRTVMVGDGINDAPALARADVGIAMGARGASASSEAADVVILVDRLDRVGEAVEIAQRARAIALQSVIVGMSLSAIAMLLAAFGWLTPVAGALSQEAIDVAVILNALRALTPPWRSPASAPSDRGLGRTERGHDTVYAALDKLSALSDRLDTVPPQEAQRLIREAADVVARTIAPHERSDDTVLYPRLAATGDHRITLDVMSRAHRDILHRARLLERLRGQLDAGDCDAMLVRDAQRLISGIEMLTRIHTAQEDDLYEAVGGAQA